MNSEPTVMPNEIVFNSHKINDIIEGFAKYFKTKVIYEKAERWIKVPKTYGDGIVGGIDFYDGVSVLVFSCHLKKDLVLRYECSGTQPLRILFCVENDFKHV